MSTLKRIFLILAAALLVVGVTAGAMKLTSSSSSAPSGQQFSGGRPEGGQDGGRDEAGGFGALELLKNLMITGGIVTVVAALSLGIDKLTRQGRPDQPALPS